MTTIDTRFVLASKLAQFLRRNGTKIIGGSCKLSLTTSALCLLNSLFIDTLHQDVNASVDLSSIDGMQEDVKFLFDFMKKVPSLKLFHGMQTLRGGVDLSHFSNVTFLELRKIPAHLIIGLSSLSLQLKALICSRSIYLLKELFGTTVSDEQNPVHLWSELKELNLSYNYLESLDSSIKSIPYIEVLDLSHNNLKYTDEIQVLKRLCFVNLSYNQLESLPIFNSLSCRYLSKLYIRNNNLENLDGLECFFNLEEFDVGYNLLSEYSALTPLDKLKSLKLLNLEGNPLYFHSQHFRLLCNYIHPFALNRGLYLNGKLIAVPQTCFFNEPQKDEEADMGRHQTSINTVVGDMHIRDPEITPVLKSPSSLILIASDKNYLEENSASSYTSQNSVERAIATGTKPKKKQRKSKSNKERVAIISEPVEEGSSQTKSQEVVNDVIPRHMMVKEIFEARREELGETWLIPDNPFRKSVNNLIVPANTPECRPGITPVLNSENNKTLNEEMFREFGKLECVASSPVVSEMKEVLEIEKDKVPDVETERKRHISNQSDDIEIISSNLLGFPNGYQLKALSAEDLSDCDFYENSARKNSSQNVNSSEMLSDSEEESEDSILLAEKVDGSSKKTISLKIGAKFAKEKDAVTNELLDKFDLSSLLSVNKSTVKMDDTESYDVQLEFDTVKKARQLRLYRFQDLKSAEQVCKTLQPFADATALREAIIGALECMKCKSQFSKQVANRKVQKTKNNPFSNRDVSFPSNKSVKEDLKEVFICPNCGNDFVVELESFPLPSVAAPPSAFERNVNTALSSGSSSVESSSSSNYMFSNLLNSFKISPVVKRKGPFITSVDEIPVDVSEAVSIQQIDKDYLKHRGSDSQMSRNSSDVTIISNPSQSSIAVIPEPGMESILNTILERDSQLSLSPPVSRSSTILSNDKENKNEDKHNGESLVLSAKDEADFYSLTESLVAEKEKPLKYSDVISNDSDVFHSPYKSAGSPDMQTAEKTDDCDTLIEILGEKNIVTYDSFLQLDHRLKLHIEIKILGREEHISSCLQTSIVPLSAGEEFEGVFLLSSKSVYVMKFLAQYSVVLEKHESLEKQVQVLYSGPLSQVKQIKVLLGNQGISVACGPPAHVYTLIIRDVDTCSSFCSLISEQIHEKNPRFECLTSAEEMLQTLQESVLTSESEEKPEVILHQFAFLKDKDMVLPICITLTKEDIFLSKVLYKKQQSCPDLAKMQAYFFVNSHHQKISDVISLKLSDNLSSVEVHFLIEASEVESTSWTIEMQTRSAMFSFISALKNPWEEIFAVPLPLSSDKIN